MKTRIFTGADVIVLNKVDLVTDETRKAARAWLGELVPDTHIIESRRGNVPLPLLLGDVKKIGLRTTHIQTADNRMVIIPNSIIGKNQVINHTYSDQNSRSETYVRVAYGTDIKGLRVKSSPRPYAGSRVCCRINRWMFFATRWANLG